MKYIKILLGLIVALLSYFYYVGGQTVSEKKQVIQTKKQPKAKQELCLHTHYKFVPQPNALSPDKSWVGSFLQISYGMELGDYFEVIDFKNEVSHKEFFTIRSLKDNSVKLLELNDFRTLNNKRRKIISSKRFIKKGYPMKSDCSSLISKYDLVEPLFPIGKRDVGKTLLLEFGSKGVKSLAGKNLLVYVNDFLKDSEGYEYFAVNDLSSGYLKELYLEWFGFSNSFVRIYDYKYAVKRQVLGKDNPSSLDPNYLTDKSELINNELIGYQKALEIIEKAHGKDNEAYKIIKSQVEKR